LAQEVSNSFEDSASSSGFQVKEADLQVLLYTYILKIVYCLPRFRLDSKK
jgi:hypothetical protein